VLVTGTRYTTLKLLSFGNSDKLAAEEAAAKKAAEEKAARNLGWFFCDLFADKLLFGLL